MIDIPANDPAHVTIRMPSPQGTASPTPASTPRTAAENQKERLVSVFCSFYNMLHCISLPAQHGTKVLFHVLKCYCDTADSMVSAAASTG